MTRGEKFVKLITDIYRDFENGYPVLKQGAIPDILDKIGSLMDENDRLKKRIKVIESILDHPGIPVEK